MNRRGHAEDGAPHAEKPNRPHATLHGALLPKLVSGEFRVWDAERFLGRAA